MNSPQVFMAAVTVGAMVIGGCGPAAAPTAAPTPVTPPVASAVPAGTPRTEPAPTQAPTIQQSVFSSYPPEKVKELLAQGFYLPGMMRGLGEQARYGGTATFAGRSDLRASDPMVYAGLPDDQVLSPIYGDGGLVRAKPSNVFDVEPYLAQSWTTSDDFRTWTFKLRPGIKWHDGAAFTADDVKFITDLAVFPPAGRKASATVGDYGPLKEVQVIDELTVRFVEKDPTPHLLETLYKWPEVMSHPKHVTKPLVDAGNVKVNLNDTGWVSIGPFKYDAYQKGASFRVVRNAQYFLKDGKGRALPYLDGIYFTFIPDATVGVSALRAGRLDGTARGTGYHLTPEMVVRVKKTLGDGAWFMRLPYVGWTAGINGTKAPFDNLKLRQALNLYTDRQNYINLIYNGFALQTDIMPPGSYWTDPTFSTWPGQNAATKGQDQAEARRLVREASMEGLAVTVTCNETYLTNCEFLGMELKGLGLVPKIEVVDSLRFLEVTTSGNYQIGVAPLQADNPDQGMILFLTTNPVSYNKHGDAKVDDYHRQVAVAVDPVQRRNIFWEAQKYLIAEKAYVSPWAREEAVVAYRAAVKGIWVPGTQVQNNDDMATTWLDTSAR